MPTTFEPLNQEAIQHALEAIPFLQNPQTDLYVYNGPESLTPYTYHEQVETLIGNLYEARLIQASDWREWWPTAEAFFGGTEKLEEADLSTLIRLFTAHIRKERFEEGHMVNLIESGYLLKLLQRLKAVALT
ncbi:MAG: DUF6508 domain-containing protein [Bacteroidota bacterium]